MEKGRLEVITGCMCCGKTEELMRRIRRAKIAKQAVVIFKPAVDTRSSGIKSRDGQTMEAVEIFSTEEILKESRNFRVIGLDEAQFFQGLIKVVNILINQGKRVIMSALDTDFRGEPFGEIPNLIAISDEHLLLTAICIKCGTYAVRSQRLINGEPAPYDSPQIMVGGDEVYEARCRNCHKVPGAPN